MLVTISYVIALLASLMWFTMAFWYWSFNHQTSSKLFVPKTQRQSPLSPTIAAIVRFLGGLNGAFALLSLVLLGLWLTGSPVFADPIERGILLLVLASAHFSQFVFNVPILKNGERQNESYWYVMKGPMYFIFVVDILETALHLFAAFVQFSTI